MDDDYISLEVNRTWDITMLPPEKKEIGYKWFYKIKYHSNNKVARHKSRLGSLGNLQREGLDYTDKVAPVPKPTTFHCLLEIASAKR